jgi:phosphate acetyltransferase
MFLLLKPWYSTIIVGSGVGKTLEELIDSLYLAYDSFKVKEVVLA